MGIIPVPKNGDLTGAANYRGITHMASAAKVYNQLLLNRIVSTADELLNGFTRSRSATAQILSFDESWKR